MGVDDPDGIMSTTPHTATETSSESTITSYLAEHPRMIGVVFTLMLVLSQAGSAAGANSSSIPGP